MSKIRQVRNRTLNLGILQGVRQGVERNEVR